MAYKTAGRQSITLQQGIHAAIKAPSLNALAVVAHGWRSPRAARCAGNRSRAVDHAALPLDHRCGGLREGSATIFGEPASKANQRQLVARAQAPGAGRRNYESRCRSRRGAAAARGHRCA
jgi:hypothetical protein